MFQILVVEDDKNARKLMKTVLTQYGYQPILATDGMEALQLMETHHIDLVLLDLMMPKMDGYTLTRTLRENNVDIPIMMITARDAFDDMLREECIYDDRRNE